MNHQDIASEHCTEEIICPYCGYEYSDSFEWPENGEETCEGCKKKFRYNRNMRIDYDTDGDCKLNGEEHDYEWVDTTNGGAWFCKKCPDIKLKEK